MKQRTSKYIIFIYIILTGSLLHAQSITPATQNIGGTLGQQGNYSLTFSVGEMISTTNFIALDKTSLSSGFLQSFTPLVTGLDNVVTMAPGTISVMPNPVVSKMYLKAKVSKPGQIAFNIVDVLSNLKYETASYTISEYLTKEVDLSQLVAGIYYVRVLFKPLVGLPEVGIYKIVKL
jgi:hypothetical protein